MNILKKSVAAFFFLCFSIPVVAEELNILTWKNYLPNKIAKQFSMDTGVKLNVVLFDSNEDLLQMLKNESVPCDVCVPSDYMVATLIDEVLLKPVDRKLVPNFKHIGSKFLNLYFDPDNRYSVPYLWGTSGIGFNRQSAGEVDSWSVLFDAKNKGKISMLNDARECFAVALKTMGKSVNDTDQKNLSKAGDKLLAQKPFVKKYDSENFADLLASGEVAFVHGYSGELAALATKSPDKFGYVVPREGSTVALDNLCVPTKAKNVAMAHALIDFLHQPKIAAMIVNETGYASSNEESKKFVDASVLANKSIYPNEETLSRCEYVKELGDLGGVLGESSTLVDDAWKKIQGK